MPKTNIFNRLPSVIRVVHKTLFLLAMIVFLPVNATYAQKLLPPPTLEQFDTGNRAVNTLITRARRLNDNGQPDKAAAELERAIRIAPRTALIWHELARIRFHQGRASDAETLASKASLLASDKKLRQVNERLIALARRSQGKSTEEELTQNKLDLALDEQREAQLIQPDVPERRVATNQSNYKPPIPATAPQPVISAAPAKAVPKSSTQRTSQSVSRGKVDMNQWHQAEKFVKNATPDPKSAANTAKRNNQVRNELRRNTRAPGKQGTPVIVERSTPGRHSRNTKALVFRGLATRLPDGLVRQSGTGAPVIEKSFVVHRARYSIAAIATPDIPPAGKCRLWFNNKPASQQPPPGSCQLLRDQVPRNAKLIVGPAQ